MHRFLPKPVRVCGLANYSILETGMSAHVSDNIKAGYVGSRLRKFYADLNVAEA